MFYEFLKNIQDLNLEEITNYDNFKHVRGGEGKLREIQQLLGILLSNFSPINKILIYHDMGAGKTCTILTIIFSIWHEFKINHFKIKNKDNKYIVFVKNKTLSTSLKNELINCIFRLNIEDEHIKTTFKNFITNNIIFWTFNEMVTTKLELENAIIIFDEAHLIHKKMVMSGEKMPIRKDNKTSLYNTILATIDRSKSCKWIFLTGTPFGIEYQKLYELLDLTLEKENRFGNNDEYIRDNVWIDNLFITNGDEIINLDENKKNTLINVIKNHVSRFAIDHETNTMKRINYGQDIVVKIPVLDSNPPQTTMIPIITIYPIYLNTNDNSIFIDAYEEDEYEEEYNPIYSSINKEKNNNEENNNEEIEDIEKKYDIFFEQMNKLFLEKINEKKVIFYYNHYIKTLKNHGNSHFKDYLKDNGWEEVTKEKLFEIKTILIKNNDSIDSDNPRNEKNTFFYIDSDVHDDVIQIFTFVYNHKNNRYGKYINLLISGDTMTVGYNFFTVRSVYINLIKNTITIDQAIARAFRGISVFPNNERVVDVYIIGILKKGNKIEDLNIIKIIKDIKIKQILLKRIIDKNAFDCPFNQTHHYALVDYSSKCNFIKCVDNFNCLVNRNNVNNLFFVGMENVFVFNTFIFERFRKHIEDIFILNGIKSIDLECLYKDFKNVMKIEENFYYYILLKHIREQHVFTNSLGLPFVLGEINNIIYVKNKNIFSYTTIDFLNEMQNIVLIKDIGSEELVKTFLLQLFLEDFKNNDKISNFNEFNKYLLNLITPGKYFNPFAAANILESSLDANINDPDSYMAKYETIMISYKQFWYLNTFVKNYSYIHFIIPYAHRQMYNKKNPSDFILDKIDELRGKNLVVSKWETILESNINQMPFKIMIHISKTNNKYIELDKKYGNFYKLDEEIIKTITIDVKNTFEKIRTTINNFKPQYKFKITEQLEIVIDNIIKGLFFEFISIEILNIINHLYIFDKELAEQIFNIIKDIKECFINENLKKILEKSKNIYKNINSDTFSNEMNKLYIYILFFNVLMEIYPNSYLKFANETGLSHNFFGLTRNYNSISSVWIWPEAHHRRKI